MINVADDRVNIDLDDICVLVIDIGIIPFWRDESVNLVPRPQVPWDPSQR